MRDTGICECGHEDWMHVPLPGFPGGCEECQADGCGCGRFRDAGSAGGRSVLEEHFDDWASDEEAP